MSYHTYQLCKWNLINLITEKDDFVFWTIIWYNISTYRFKADETLEARKSIGGPFRL